MGRKRSYVLLVVVVSPLATRTREDGGRGGERTMS